MYSISSDGQSYCRLLARLKDTQHNDRAVSNGPAEWMSYYGDELFSPGTSLGMSGFRSGWVPTAQCLGIPKNPFDTSYPVDFRVHRPIHQDYVGGQDFRNYYLTGSSFFSGFPGESFQKENGVRHLTYSGDVKDTSTAGSEYFLPSNSLSDVKTLYGNVSVPGYHLSTEALPQYQGFGAKLIGTNAKGNGIFELHAQSPYYFVWPEYDLKDALHAYDLVFAGGSPLNLYLWSAYTARYENWVNNSVFTDYAFHIDVSYDYTLEWDKAVRTHEITFSVHRVIDVGFRPFFGSNSPSNINFPGEGPWVVSDQSTVVEKSHIFFWSWTQPYIGLVPRLVVDWCTINGGLNQVEAGNVPNFARFRMADSYEYRQNLNRRTDLHRNLMDAMMSDIRPSSFLSAADALNKHLEALSTNHIQSLQKLHDVLALLPDLVALPRLIQKISRGDVTAIKDLIDYISDAILRYKFSQAPAARAIEEIVGSDVQAYLDTLAKSSSYTIYGDFKYVFKDNENSYGDGRLELVTRSKIRISQDLSTMVEALLTANCVGLMPSFARIWEVLPFSFVVDWFTGMNKRLKLLDTQLLYTVFRTDWCLHSYKLTYYPSEAYLATFGLESSLTKPFGVSSYIREKSVYMPRLRESSYDFLAARGPNPVTAGALTWQLFT